ncbi:MAG: ABC transporter permease [Acidobacteria bacterium]|nr:ABC transporter permease [Acidobacteriota bacterium]MCI0718042.1 ABC transporter permease [Acidobacteriota bacterium]
MNQSSLGIEATEPQPLKRKARPVSLSRETGLVVLTLLLILVFSILFPRSFPTFANFTAILRNLALDGIMAAGMMVMMVGGLFDLSVGGMFSMVGVLTGWLLKEAGLPVPLAILGGLMAAALGGLVNGWIVARIRVNALIATLGTMGIFRGIAILMGGPGINFLPPTFTQLGQSVFLGMQAPIWLMLAVVGLYHFLMSRTRLFRQYYYIGSNPKAADLSGINVAGMQMLGFVQMGLLAGLSGIVFASRIGTSVSIAGDGAELRIITAVILGGASLTGGKGTIWGGLAGVAFIALIQNVLIIAAVSSYWQSIIIGVVLVLAVAMDSLLNRQRV